jgi:hypothetical protein
MSLPARGCVSLNVTIVTRRRTTITIYKPSTTATPNYRSDDARLESIQSANQSNRHCAQVDEKSPIRAQWVKVDGMGLTCHWTYHSTLD